jgi:hypothetical protein
VFRRLMQAGQPKPTVTILLVQHARGPELHGARGLRPLPQWAPAVSVVVDGAVLIFR